MALVRLFRGGRVTLPADVLEALRLAEGDHLEAEVADGAVRLRPVAVDDRAAAWRDIMEIVRRDKWIGPEPRPSPEEEEQWIFDVLAEERDGRD